MRKMRLRLPSRTAWMKPFRYWYTCAPCSLSGPNFQFPQDFCFIVLRRLDQPHHRMVQTGNALIRSHRRSANSLASMMFQLRAQAVPLSPAARQVQAQAEASDETTASKATATTSEASIPLILILLGPHGSRGLAAVAL